MHSTDDNNRGWYRNFPMAFVFSVIFGGLTAFAFNARAGEIVTGQVERVWDGDTLTIGETVIRLYGIDAPERGQT